VAGSPARAERAASCQQDSVCWRELGRGSKLAEAADYSGALAAFELAFARVPDPRLQINIGRSLHRLGRYDEAIAAFEHYQATAPTTSPPEEQEVVRRFLTEAQQAKHQSPPTPPPPPATETPVYKKWSYKKFLNSDGAGCWNEGQSRFSLTKKILPPVFRS
jgi:tetratricopeptide (TPR) repeat protein